VKGRVLLTLVLLLLAACGGGAEPSAEELKKQAESIQSFAAEGALLARDVADGKSTVPFTRVHAEELAEKAAQLEKELAAASRLQVWVQGARLAGQVAAALEELEQAPGDAESARRVQRELEAAAKQAEKLASA
jgi:outer membrane biogenesis lipoprotein LolB